MDAVVAGAVGKWKSRCLCGISKRRGKPAFGFPRSGFSTALFTAQLQRKFRGRSIPEAAVRALLVVLFPPRPDLPLRIEQILKPAYVQTFFPHPPVETFHPPVL